MQLALDALEGYTLDACHAGLDTLQMLQATVPECLAPYVADIVARLFLCFSRFGPELRSKLALSIRTLAGFAPGRPPASPQRLLQVRCVACSGSREWQSAARVRRELPEVS